MIRANELSEVAGYKSNKEKSALFLKMLVMNAQKWNYFKNCIYNSIKQNTKHLGIN